MADTHTHDHADEHGHDDHGHGGHGTAVSYPIIAEDSAADMVLNFSAWLAFVALFAFSLVMVTAAPHHAEAGDAHGAAGQQHAAPVEGGAAPESHH